MRVLVACDALSSLTSAQAGATLARAWAECGAQAAVVPIGSTGAGLDQALVDLWAAADEIVGTPTGPVRVVRTVGKLALSAVFAPVPGIDTDASSAVLGQVLAAEVAAAAEPLDTVVLEVTGPPWHDGGAGFVEALEPAAHVLRDSRLVLAVARDETGVPLTGLRGITSRRGRGDDGAAALDAAELLRIDQTLADHAVSIGLTGNEPGSGAAGGLGAAVLALGGEVSSGPSLVTSLTGLDQSAARADLMVTGQTQLDFGTMGGDVLAELAELAARHLVPLVVVAGTNYISGRELRSIGVEAAYSVDPDLRRTGDGSAVISADELLSAARPVAATWSW